MGCRPSVLAFTVAVAAALLVAAGCGGARSSGIRVAHLESTTPRSSSSPNTSPASGYENGAPAFSRCMRSHGVSTFADPNASGQLPKETPQQLGVTNSQFQTADAACQHLLSNGGQPTQAALQQSWSDFRKFTQCMHHHGVPTWPEPSRYPAHPERPTFDLQSVGIDPNAPQVTIKIRDCVPLLRGNNPQRLGEGGA